jgi:predicted dienelactone hydrolase
MSLFQMAVGKAMIWRNQALRRVGSMGILLLSGLLLVSWDRPGEETNTTKTEPSEVSLTPPPAGAGFRKIDLSYHGGDGGERKRNYFLWYPTATEPSRHDYHNGQIGSVAIDAEVVEDRQPLILYSHGSLGAGDHTVFLMEALARKGYIVAAINHSNASIPNYVDPNSWDDTTHHDRKEDLTALLDHLLAENKRDGSFLHNRIDEEAIGAAGHSLGGYTVLGVVGAWDSWRDKRVRAVLLLSPFATPFIAKDTLKGVSTPVMLQGGTLDWANTPVLSKVYEKVPSPKYFLVLKNVTHLGWTNLISLSKTTTDIVKDGNPQLMTDYSIAFFDRHLRGKKDVDLLQQENTRLESYQYKVE